MCSSATDSAIDSFHTAQEGSSICISYGIGAVWMQGCQMDEVTSRVSAPHPSKRHQHHAYKLHSMHHCSISGTPLQSTADVLLAGLSKAPESMLGKGAMPLRKPPPETPPACKRLCTRALSGQPVTPETQPRQSCRSALGKEAADAPPAASQPNEETVATPETPCSEPQRRRSGNPKLAQMAVLQTATRQAHSSSKKCGLPLIAHSGELLGELRAGENSPNRKAQVRTNIREVMLRMTRTHLRGQMPVYRFCRTQTHALLVKLNEGSISSPALQASVSQVRLAARAGLVQAPDQSAASRRRLSFFAQLRRPVQALHSPL